MNTEQSEYNSLKAASFQISEQIMSYCDHINSVGGNPTYSILATCVRQEQTSAASNADRSFHY